jgi:hypothetical protein
LLNRTSHDLKARLLWSAEEISNPGSEHTTFFILHAVNQAIQATALGTSNQDRAWISKELFERQFSVVSSKLHAET